MARRYRAVDVQVLNRKTPLKRKSAKARRIKQPCGILRCKHPPDRGLLVCLTHAKRLADEEFARRVRERGVCADQAVRPHTCLGGFQCAHGWSRGDLGTRWDEDNVFCLCGGAHLYYTMHPTQWYAWMMRVQGHFQFEVMRIRALTPVKVDYVALFHRLDLGRYASAE